MVNSLVPDQFIVKSNNLVEARYRLSLQESHVVLWLLTQIKPDDEDFKPHQLKVVDFAKMVGLRVDSQYEELQKTTLRLMQRVMRIRDTRGKKLIQVSWLSSAVYEDGKGYVSLEFSPQLKPYLLQLKSQFTKINIADTMKFKSIYTVRIFELLIQYESIGKRVTSINDLRDWCVIRKGDYELYANLKRDIINRAKNEINAKTEYVVDYREIKESRKVVAIEWTFQKRTHFEKQQLEKSAAMSHELQQVNSLVKELIEYGFTKHAANKIIKNHDEIDITNAIKAVDVYRVNHDVKNPKALINKAIKERWKPDVYKTKKS
jgi:plasmid replication initiation protein